MKKYQGKSVVKMGIVEGPALVTNNLVAFWGGTNWETGEIVELGNEIQGENVCGKILVFPSGKGGAGETYGFYYLARSGNAPKALICNRSLGQTVAGAILTRTPLIYGFEEDIVSAIKNGDIVRIDTETGSVEVSRGES